MIRSSEKYYSNSILNCVWCLVREELTRDTIARKILLELKLKPQAGSVSVGLCEGEPTRVILRSPEKNITRTQA